MRSKCARVPALALGVALIAVDGAPAEVLTVCPDGTGDYTGIQEAIDAAVDGDVVELCDGLHPSLGIEFRGKAITVRSASGDPESCSVIGPVLFQAGEGLASVLAGVSITRQGSISAVWCENASPTIEDVRVVDSANLASGGVVLVHSDAVFRRCVVEANSATDADVGDVGGVEVHSSSPRFEECVIAGNSARLSSGGVRCVLGTPTFVRCTVAGNRAGGNGGGIRIDLAQVTMDHCILRGNCAGTVGDEAFVDAGGRLTLICCDVDSTGFAGAGTIEYVGENLFVDPLFCDPAPCESAPTLAGDYTLAANSPCLTAPGCGQIGAFGQGCGMIAVTPWSWGRVKGLYRVR